MLKEVVVASYLCSLVLKPNLDNSHTKSRLVRQLLADFTARFRRNFKCGLKIFPLLRREYGSWSLAVTIDTTAAGVTSYLVLTVVDAVWTGDTAGRHVITFITAVEHLTSN